MTDRLAEIEAAYRNNKGLTGRTIRELIAEVERLKAENEELITTFNSAHYINVGMERAAVIVGLVPEVEGEHLRTTITAAIRAEVKASHGR